MPSRRTMLAATLLPWLGAPARAQSWPNRLVKVIVPYPPGGSTDISARLFAERMSTSLGQRLIVDNRGGAAANLGMEQTAASEPDGYTIGVATTAHAINATLFKSLAYDIRKSFVPVALMTESPLIAVVNPAVPARSIAELIALANAKPGELTFASTGNGGSPHLAAENFAHVTGVKLRHVPYRGSAPAIADVMAGHVQLMFDTTQSVLEHVRGGRVRALASAFRERLDIAPDIQLPYTRHRNEGCMVYIDMDRQGVRKASLVPTRMNEEKQAVIVPESSPEFEESRRFVDWVSDRQPGGVTVQRVEDGRMVVYERP